MSPWLGALFVAGGIGATALLVTGAERWAADVFGAVLWASLGLAHVYLLVSGARRRLRGGPSRDALPSAGQLEERSRRRLQQRGLWYWLSGVWFPGAEEYDRRRRRD